MATSRLGSLPRSRTTPLTLRQLRESLGVSQGELARALDSSQPAVLKTETSSDLRVSSLRRFVEGLGSVTDTHSEIRIVASIGDEEHSITMPSDVEHDPEVATDASAWRLRAWDDPALEAAWMDQNLISMSADEIGGVTPWPGDERVARLLSEALPERSDQAIGTFVTYWRYFVQEMRVGDIVVTPMSGKRAGIARIIGGYNYDADASDPRLRHLRPVEWLRVRARADLDDDIRKVVNAPGTVCRIGAANAAERLS